MLSANIMLSLLLLIFLVYLVSLFFIKPTITQSDARLVGILATILWLFMLAFSGFTFLDHLFVKSTRSSVGDFIGGVTMATFFVEIILCLASLLFIGLQYRSGEYREVIITAAVPYIGGIFFISMFLLMYLLKLVL